MVALTALIIISSHWLKCVIHTSDQAGPPTMWVGDFIEESPLLCVFSECGSFRRLNHVQGLWTSTTERFKKGGGRQTKAQRRAQRGQNKGRGPGRGLPAEWGGFLSQPGSLLMPRRAQPVWQRQVAPASGLLSTLRLRAEASCWNSSRSAAGTDVPAEAARRLCALTDPHSPETRRVV